MSYKNTQIAFQALLSGNITNATGDGTTVTVIYDLPSYNFRSGYNPATGVFTAQATGLYSFSGTICLENLGAAHVQLLSQGITTIGITYNAYEINPFVIADSGNLILQFAFDAFMELADTIHMAITVGGGTKTVTLGGAGAFALNCFSGKLII